MGEQDNSRKHKEEAVEEGFHRRVAKREEVSSRSGENCGEHIQRNREMGADRFWRGMLQKEEGKVQRISKNKTLPCISGQDYEIPMCSKGV